MDIRLFLVDDLGRRDEVRYLGRRIIKERVAREHEIRVRQLHLLAEHRLFGVRPVVTADGDERVQRVAHRAAMEIVRYAGSAVVVQTVGRQNRRVLVRPPVHQPYVPPHAR